MYSMYSYYSVFTLFRWLTLTLEPLSTIGKFRIQSKRNYSLFMIEFSLFRFLFFTFYSDDYFYLDCFDYVSLSEHQQHRTHNIVEHLFYAFSIFFFSSLFTIVLIKYCTKPFNTEYCAVLKGNRDKNYLISFYCCYGWKRRMNTMRCTWHAQCRCDETRMNTTGNVECVNERWMVIATAKHRMRNKFTGMNE